MNGAAGRRSVLNWIDGLLVLVATGLAVWSAGESINIRDVSVLFVTLTAAGGLFSTFVRWIGRGQSWLRADGWLYAGIAITVVFNLGPLNALLPEDGFPRQIGAAGFLCWTIGFGSFVGWRDGTMLFGTIPAMALFGLCGCFDTYRPLPLLFFIFLLCLATLLARAHAREMLRQAKASGFGGDLPEDSPLLAERIRRGPWRWLAGPEWALASALGIVLLSSLGAPVVQRSVRDVAGIVPIQPPPIRRNPGSTPQGGAFQNQSQVQVGRGPNDSLTKTPVFEVRMDPYRYLRTAAYDEYTGTGWATSGLRPDSFQGDWSESALASIANPQDRPFTVRPLTPQSVIPVPGELLSWNTAILRRTREGGWTGPATTGRVVYDGVVRLPADESAGRSARQDIPEAFRAVSASPRLSDRTLEFVRSTVAGAKDDRDKAERLRRAIADTIVYNLRSEAVPTGADPVDTVLFVTKEGYCDLYATAMTVCARAAGLPARYVQGFLPDRANRDTGGSYVVLESDYHAWSEVWFEGVGWVVFDATEGTREVPGEGRGDTTERESIFSGERGQMLANVAIAVVLLGGVVGAAWSMRPGARPFDPRAGARDLAESLARAYERRRRHRREPGETLAEMGRAAGTDADLLRDIEAALYAPISPVPGTLAQRVRAEIARLSRRSE